MSVSGQLGDKKGPVPASDKTITHQRKLLLSAGNVRYENSGLNFDASVGEGRFSPRALTLVWKERESKGRYYDHYREDPDGSIGKQSSSLKVLLSFNSALISVLAALRPGDVRLGCPIASNYQIKELRAKAQRYECVVVARRDHRSIDGLSDELWLEPSHGYRIVRMHGFGRRIGGGNGRPALYVRQTIEFEYGEAADGVWYPRSWKTTIVQPGGQYLLSESSASERFQRPGTVDDSAFDLDFPVGTWIQDADLANSPNGGYFIQQAGGKRRLILDAELAAGASQKDLLNTDTGDLLPERKSTMGWWFVAGLVGFLLSLFVVLSYFYKRRRKT